MSAPGQQGFSAERRVRHPSDFERVYDQGRSQVGRFMVLWVFPTASALTRVGVVASRRTFRRAHDRNRAKRLLREAFRLQADRFVAGLDMVLVARRRILEVKRQDVDRELSALGARHKVMENP